MTLRSSKGSILAMACYVVSLDGADDTCGDVETIGHASLIRGPIDVASLDPDDRADVDEETAGTLSTMAGAIVYADDRGWVSVDVFEDAEMLEARWTACEAIDAEACNEAEGGAP